MLVLTVVLFCLTAILLTRKTGSALNPVVLIFAYFYGLLVLSQLSTTGLTPPSNVASSYFLLAFFSASLGALQAKAKRKVGYDFVFFSNKSALFFVISALCFLPIALILIMNLRIIASIGYDAFVSSVRFEGESVDVAGSVFMTSLIDRVSRPLAILAAIIGTAIFISKKEKRLFAVGVFSIVALSFLYVKRIDLMVLLVIFLSGLLCARNRENRVRKAAMKKYYFLLIMLLVVIFAISNFRASSYGLYHLILHYGVGYHTFGFALFDHALHNPSSHIHDLVLPGSTIFSTVDFVFSQIYGLLGGVYVPLASYLYSEELGDFVFFGYNSFNGMELSANAFYTSLYPIYRDAGIFGIFLFPFVYGYFLSRSYMTYVFHGDLRSLVWVIFFSWVGYASLLTPVIMGVSFWFIPLLIFVIFRFRWKSVFLGSVNSRDKSNTSGVQ